MDQPQPVSQVLLVPVHRVMTQILSTSHCRPLSSSHILESGVLSDTMWSSSTWTSPVEKEDRCCSHSRHAWCWHPQGDPAPQDSPACRRRKTTQSRRQGLMAGAGGWRALWVSVDEREKGSPGSPSEMSLSLPGPTGNLSLRGHAPSPRGSNQK